MNTEMLGMNGAMDSWIKDRPSRTMALAPKSAILAGLLGLAVLAGCTTNPTTGRSQFLTMSRDEEIKLGAEAAPELTTEFGGKVDDAQLQSYVNNIGHKLAAQTEADNPALPWEFTLLDSAVINAFALPGGKVFFSRGLAAEMTNEAQMAAVLGHEIGHVTARHGNERYGQAIGTSVGGALLGAVIGGVVTGDASGVGIGAGAGATVGGIAGLAYSRDQEVEADRLGMRYMEKIGYDPSAAIEVQGILQRAAAKGGGGQLEILSTHPSSETRIRELEKRLDKYYAHTRNNPQYQKFDQRFQNEFLARLQKLPPPKQANAGSTREMMANAAFGGLGDPVLWCAHCRHAAATK
jgi:predicted Zn-dependent protease